MKLFLISVFVGWLLYTPSVNSADLSACAASGECRVAID